LSAAPPASLGRRLLWMLAIWSASVAALGVVAMGIRLAIKHG
jgi:hypothetical protein